MKSGHSEPLIRDLDRLFGTGTVTGLTDAQLLERFVACRDEEAFAALVARHGPRVLWICRRVLKDENDAEDAFQAAFLILARKAGSLRVDRSLAGWLYRVSSRLAIQADRHARKQQRREERVARMRPDRVAEPPDSHLGPLLLEEVDRLPEKYRLPILFCGLEGMTHEAAAQQLGCPVGTVSGRLSRARDLLRTRLIRRGVTIPSGFLVAGISSQSASASVSAFMPKALVASTVEAMRKVLMHGTVPASGAAIGLMEGELRRMWISKSIMAGLPLIAVGITVLGLGGFAQQADVGPPPNPELDQKKSVDSPNAAGVVVTPSKARLLRDISQVIGNTADTPNHVHTLIAIAKAQAKAGDRAAAMGTLEAAGKVAGKLIPKDRSFTLTSLAYAHWEVGNRSLIRDILGRALEAATQANDRERGESLARVAEAQAWTMDLGAARETVKQVEQIVAASPTENEKFFAAMTLVRLQTVVGEFDAALATVDAFANDYITGSLLREIAGAIGSANQNTYQPPRELSATEKKTRLEILHRIQKSYQNPPPELAVALADLGETDHALKICRQLFTYEIEQRRGDPTALPYILMRIGQAQARANQPDAAKATFQEALGLIHGHPELASRLEQVAYGQAESGHIEEALATAGLIEPAARVATLIHIAETQAKGHDRGAARKTLQHALECAWQALADPPKRKPGSLGNNSKYQRSWRLMEVARVQAKLGNFTQALEATRDVLPQLKLSVLLQVAKEQTLAGEAEEVWRWANKLEQSDERLLALQGLVQGLLEISPRDEVPAQTGAAGR